MEAERVGERVCGEWELPSGLMEVAGVEESFGVVGDRRVCFGGRYGPMQTPFIACFIYVSLILCFQAVVEVT